MKSQAYPSADELPGGIPSTTKRLGDARARTREQRLACLKFVGRHKVLVAELNRIGPSGAWTTYLRIPQQLPHGDSEWKKMTAAARQYDFMAKDEKYDVITALDEFAETHSTLRDWVTTQQFPEAPK